LTLGDCGLPITLFWIEALAPVLGLTIEWPDAVRAYRERVMALPAVAAEFETYRAPALEWIDLAGQDKA
jgi:hypothetical protein